MRLLAAAAVAALAAVPAAQAAPLRTLVLPATWGPALPAAADLEAELREADAFYRRASFGALGVEGDVAEPLTGFVVPPACGLGTLTSATRAAAVARGYDVSGYDRFVHVFPEPVCGFTGLGVGRDVLLAGVTGALVHELGHTLGLPHASGSRCAPAPRDCGRLEYGDPFSPMGHGGVDLSAREKVELGWLPRPPTVAVPGRYRVGTPHEPGPLPPALVVRVPAGELWLEDVRVWEPRLVVRLLRASELALGRLAHTVYLASGRDAVSIPGVLRARREGGELTLEWNDRDRPTRPRWLAVSSQRRGRTFDVSWLASEDAGSGVAHYRVRVDGRMVATTEETSATLRGLSPGRHRLGVTALDLAGNTSRPAQAALIVRRG